MLQPLLLLHLQISQTEIGTLLFISSVSSSLIRIPAGIISDRYGRKLSVLIACITLTAAAASFMFARNFVELMLPFSLWGIGAGVYFTTNNVLIADLTDENTRVKAYARITMIGQTTSLISPLITGFLADNLGLVVTYLFPTTSFLAMFLLSSRLQMKIIRKRENAEERQENLRESLRNGGLKNIVITFTTLNVIHGLYAGIFWPARTIIYRNQFNLEYSEIGFLNSGFMIAQVLGLALSNRIAFRLKPKLLLAGSTVCSALIVTCYSIVNSTFWLMPLSLIHGFSLSFGFQSPIGRTILMNNIPSQTRGTIQGVIGTLWRAGMASGGLAMGGIWATYGILMIPWVGSAFLLIESIIILARLPEK
jgi:MFS family permease